MIKSAIATAVVAATTATAVADVKVYGRLRVVAISTDVDGAADSVIDLENRSSRFGIKASSEISDGLTAFGRYEFGVDGSSADLQRSGTADGSAQRLAYVGLKGGFGEISLGTRWSPYYSATVSYNDPTNAFGGTWNNGAGFNTDFRNTDTLNYSNKFGAANVGLQVQIKDNGAGDDNDVDEVSLGASFKVGSATIGLGYLATADVADIFGIHARTKFGPFGIAGHYSSRSEDGVGVDNDAFNIVADYGFGGGKTLYVSYGKTDNDTGNDPEQLAAEYVHTLGGGFKWFGGFSIDDTGAATDAETTRVGVGVRYDF